MTSAATCPKYGGKVCRPEAGALCECYPGKKPSAATCSSCKRGAESCGYCEGLDARDVEAICDCGLIDFGAHLIDCAGREAFKYVIASDYAQAKVKRDAASNTPNGDKCESAAATDDRCGLWGCGRKATTPVSFSHPDVGERDIVICDYHAMMVEDSKPAYSVKPRSAAESPEHGASTPGPSSVHGVPAHAPAAATRRVWRLPLYFGFGGVVVTIEPWTWRAIRRRFR